MKNGNLKIGNLKNGNLKIGNLKNGNFQIGSELILKWNGPSGPPYIEPTSRNVDILSVDFRESIHVFMKLSYFSI